MFRKSIICVLLFVVSVQAQRSDWPNATPKSVGLDQKALAQFDAEIASGKFGNIDGLTVVRHGKLVFDKRYEHDPAKIYGEIAKKESPLNAGDLSGPYNYYNSWWRDRERPNSIWRDAGEKVFSRGYFS